MKMKMNLGTVIGVGGCVIGLIGVGYAIGSNRKMGDICNKIGVAIDNLASRTDVDVSEGIVKQAINKAVDSETNRIVRKVTTSVIDTMEKDIHSQVASAVVCKTSEIGEAVTDKIAKEVSKIDMNALSAKVTEKAQDAVLKKFDGNLDGILNKFNNDLNNVSKIYNSIANNMANNSNNNVAKTITLGM